MALLETRQVNGQWQVLLDSPTKWHDCETEFDAMMIARGQDLAALVHAGKYADKDRAEDAVEQLEKMEEVFARNFGSSTALRYIQGALKKARTDAGIPAP